MTDQQRQSRETYRRKLRQKLRELFQFDVADLDFGIYRILNAKRDRIERFIDDDLIEAVGEALADYSDEAASDLQEELQTAEAQLDAVEARIAEIFDSPEELLELKPESDLARDYREAKAKVDEAGQRLDRAQASAELEAEIYNDLYHFFERYYDEGDFHSERRYSSREHKYMVPHDGEEVFLHWANKDQYYIKTGERFRNYRFNVEGAGDWDVWFKVEEADVPTDNNKGDDRYFLLKDADPIDCDEDEELLTVRFVRKPLDEDEKQALIDAYNEIADDDSKSSMRGISIPRVIAARIEEAVDDPNLLGRLKAEHPASNAGSSVLLHHLAQFTAKNTRDYFIHKDPHDHTEVVPVVSAGA